jgi:hypothetical protein
MFCGFVPLCGKEELLELSIRRLELAWQGW